MGLGKIAGFVIAASILTDFTLSVAHAQEVGACNKVGNRKGKGICSKLKEHPKIDDVKKFCPEVEFACDQIKKAYESAHKWAQETCEKADSARKTAQASNKDCSSANKSQACSKSLNAPVAKEYKAGNGRAGAPKKEIDEAREQIREAKKCVKNAFEASSDEQLRKLSDDIKAAENGEEISPDSPIADLDENDKELGAAKQEVQRNESEFANKGRGYDNVADTSGGRERDLGSQGAGDNPSGGGSQDPPSAQGGPQGESPKGEQPKPQQQAEGGAPPSSSPGGGQEKAQNTITDPNFNPERVGEISSFAGPEKEGEKKAEVAQVGANFGKEEEKKKEEDTKNVGVRGPAFVPASAGAVSAGVFSRTTTQGSGTGSDSLRQSLRSTSSASSSGSVGNSAPSGDTYSPASGKRERIPLSSSSSSYSSDSSYSSGGGGGSGAPSDDPAATFAKPLGNPKISLLGSETDDQIRQMVGTFNAVEYSAKVAPASEWEDGIGDKFGASLFERARNSHENCLRRGCVTANSYRRTAAR